VSITVIAVEGLPEVEAGADLPELIARQAGNGGLQSGDVVVVAHKAVSKAEGRVYPGADRIEAARAESKRILRRAGDMLISETHHGFVCANAGVDASNIAGDRVVLLPLDPDLSARRLRKRLEMLAGVEIGVVISDTFGRAWRIGQTNVAIGVAGIDPFIDYRDTLDSHGRELSATRICIADEIAGAAEMVMGKALGIPVAIVRGAPVRFGRGAATTIVRPPGEDLFR
jgi:coenzyme F420-0:L-glutamate ligase / coenzyme F420-1:gamma-L-glutamate ligase